MRGAPVLHVVSKACNLIPPAAWAERLSLVFGRTALASHTGFVPPL